MLHAQGGGFAKTERQLNLSLVEYSYKNILQQ
jgi:hypothetical protein